MKMKNTVLRTLIVIMVAIFGIGIVLPSLAVQNENKNLALSYFRYVNGEPTIGYKIQSNGEYNQHPVFQIVPTDSNSPKKTAYYCLSALYGNAWTRTAQNPNGNTNNTAEYKQYYDLDNEINDLANDTNEKYSVIAGEYKEQILWILENLYIPGESDKNSFLAKAGIIYGEAYESKNAYKYNPSSDYDYTNKLNDATIGERNRAKYGWFYFDANDNYISLDITDDVIETAQQLALWYYTNYKLNNPNNDETFNFKDHKVELFRGVYGKDISSSIGWSPIDDYVENAVNNSSAKLGLWIEDQVTILTSYLIDAADNYAKSDKQQATGNPIDLTPKGYATLTEKNDNYIIGKLNIKENRTNYDLDDKIYVTLDPSSNNYISEAFISDADGNRIDQKLTNYIGKDFYIAIPKSKINNTNKSDITIMIKGTENTTTKKMWINSTVGEQPIVEVAPQKINFDLSVKAKIPEKPKLFDLALRKRIIAINGKSTDDDIKNEAGYSAVRASDKIDTNSIPTTATYKHRKDPVVVKKGDIVTYSITVYNEGEIDGYAKTIIDKLPQGLALKGFTDNKTTTGIFKKGNVNYSYVYNKDNNTITFTNNSENVLSKFEETLDSETIEIECEVVQEPSTTSNTYLTNIAYISEAYKKETETPEKVVEDRDSRTDRNPSSTQNTTGDKYEGYHGSSDKDVYNNTDNEKDYFPGMEDDDDFEIVVVKPAPFDLALRKYITNVIKPDGTMKPGKNAPIINTSNLIPNGKEKTANYDLDKNPIKVKSGDYVLYTITVYNEGEVDGYIKKITDNIPEGLEFVIPNEENSITSIDSKGNPKNVMVSEAIYKYVSNYNQFWAIDKDEKNDYKKDNYNGKETISISCNVESADLENSDGFLKAYDSSKDVKKDGTGLDRISVQVLLRVSDDEELVKALIKNKDRIRNEAAITKVTLDKEGKIEQEIGFKDRDSQTNQWPGKEPGDNYQDDEDYDHIVLERVDLALTKFITAVSNDIKIEDGEYLTKDKTKKDAGSELNPYDRATKVDTTPLINGTATDAIYTQVKTSLPVPAKSYVLYNIRVYNEGDVDVYAGEVKDYLPNYLDFVEGEFNNSYGWKVASDGKTVTTNLLSKVNGTDKILKAFDKENDDTHGSHLDYKDLPILCRVNTKAPDKTKLVNSSEITKYEDEDGNEIKEDIDSQPDNLPEDKKNEEGKPEGRYDQDDEDYEVIEIEKPIVDLALTKFIVAISNDTDISDGEYLTPNGSVGSKENPYDRATEVITKDLKEDPNCHDADYHMIKDGLVVPAQSYVLYNIRVYNEGQTDVYAGEVTDHLPEYLDYVDCEFNKNFGWSVASDGKTISTTYLSHDVNPDKILKAFDRDNDDKHGSGLDYQDLQVLCRINDNAPTNTNIVNVAEITRYENEDGNPIPEEDIDSRPKNVNEKNEDDDDYEVVLIKTFDLSLLKYVSEVYVTEDGKTTTTKTGNTGDNSKDIIPKVEINKKKLNSTVVKFGYTIKITNEGDIEGYAKEITDYVPEGLKFYAEDNNGWKDEGNNVISTRLLENTLLKPGESAEVKVIFRWINGSNNLGLKTNVAEISEDYNKEGVPDRDSTPDNRKEGEDDIDNAKVILSIKTGLIHNFVIYATVGLVILIVLGTGIITIKKYVL